MAQLKLVAGRSNRAFAEKIAKALNVKLAGLQIKNFSDGEIWVKYDENIRGVDLFIVQSTMPPAENLMELLMLKIGRAHV